MCRSKRWACYVVSLGWVLGACATPPGDSAPDAFDVVLDPSVVSQSTVLGAAWSVYGLARVKAYGDLKSVRHNPAADDYLIELRARAELAAFWRDQQGKPDVPSDSYLDRLVEIDAAGNLEEHVLASLFKPGWTIPAPELERIDWSALEHALPRGETPTWAAPWRRSESRRGAAQVRKAVVRHPRIRSSRPDRASPVAGPVHAVAPDAAQSHRGLGA